MFNNKYELQQQLENYLNTITKKSKGKNQYICPICGSGTGQHHTGALYYKIDNKEVPRCTCFSCGQLQNSDIFEAIGKIENIPTFKKQYKRAMELFGHTQINSKNNPIKKKDRSPAQEHKQMSDYSIFFLKAHNSVANTNYLLNRGISQEVIDKFCIGFSDNWKHPKSNNMVPKKGIIIPISKYSYIFRDIETTKSEYRYFRIKTKNTPEDKFLGFQCLTSSETPIYIVEGELDALSIFTAGHNAVSLGSISNASDFLDACKDLNIKAPLIAFTDKDEAGQTTLQLLNLKLKETNIYRQNKGLDNIIMCAFPYEKLEKMQLKNIKDANDILLQLGQEKFNKYLTLINSIVNKSIAKTTLNETKKVPIKEKDGCKSQITYLTVDKYIAEKQDQILNVVNNSKKSLLIAPMGTGKTNLIPDINKDKDTVVVIVNPSVAQLKQMANNYKIPAIYGGLSYDDESIVCVTPESLKKKVIAKLNKPFILVVDEAHEIYSSYNFRKKFADIKDVEQMAKSTIYMTATPDILLETEQFNDVIIIQKPNEAELQTQILEVNKMTIEYKTSIIKELLKKHKLVVFHNDDKEENKAITEFLNKKMAIKVEEDENFQLNLMGIEPEYKIKEKDTAISIDASKKDEEIFKELSRTSKIDKDARVFCSTSFIKAGFNIENDRDTAIVYSCHTQGFKKVNFLQTIGRYRNRENIKEIVLLKNKLDKTEQTFRNFDSIYKDYLYAAEYFLPLINYMYKKYKQRYLSNTLAKETGFLFDSKTQSYTIDYHQLKAQAHAKYNKGFMYYPEILKKQLENDDAIKLKVSIEDYTPEPEQEIKEILKLRSKERKELFKNTTNKMLTLNNDTLLEILEYNIDQRKAENQELIEIMKNYNETVSTTFKNILDETVETKKCNKAEAFKYILNHKTLQEAKKDLLKYKVCQINQDIKEKGIDLVYESLKGQPRLEKQVILIRYILKDIEERRGYLNNKAINEIANKSVENRIYKLSKNTTIKDIEKETKELVNIIYKIDKKNQIKSINGTQ